MKKKNVKNLSLQKKTISNLVTTNHLKGGGAITGFCSLFCTFPCDQETATDCPAPFTKHVQSDCACK